MDYHGSSFLKSLTSALKDAMSKAKTMQAAELNKKYAKLHGSTIAIVKNYLGGMENRAKKTLSARETDFQSLSKQ